MRSWPNCRRMAGKAMQHLISYHPALTPAVGAQEASIVGSSKKML
jgi:hypothetical protein